MDRMIQRRAEPETDDLRASGLHPLLARVYAARGIASLRHSAQFDASPAAHDKAMSCVDGL